MLGLLVIAGIAAAAVMPDVIRAVSDADLASDDPTEDGGDAVDNQSPSILDAEPPETTPNVFEISVDPGVHAVDGFDPGTDILQIALPAEADEFQITPADPETGAPATLKWDQQDGAVTVQFDDLQDVPVNSVALRFEGSDDPMTLSDLLILQDNGPLLPGDPTLPAEPEPEMGDEPDPETVLVPTDPELPDEPTPADEGDDADPLVPVEDVPSFVEDATVADEPDRGSETLPTAMQVVRFDEFIRGEDVVAIRAADAADLTIATDASGTGSDIFTGGELIAQVPGIAGLTLQDIVVIP